jgi:hypothetical protein
MKDYCMQWNLLDLELAGRETYTWQLFGGKNDTSLVGRSTWQLLL